MFQILKKYISWRSIAALIAFLLAVWYLSKFFGITESFSLSDTVMNTTTIANGSVLYSYDGQKASVDLSTSKKNITTTDLSGNTVVYTFEGSGDPITDNTGMTLFYGPDKKSFARVDNGLYIVTISSSGKQTMFNRVLADKKKDTKKNKDKKDKKDKKDDMDFQENDDSWRNNRGSDYDSEYNKMMKDASNYAANGYRNNMGIPGSQIPPGDEDLYILKSQVIPPVCPTCPAPIVKCPIEDGEVDLDKCPPCPACARCPEDNFECKKVPSMKNFSSGGFPVPVLNDFSTFGM